MSQRFLSHAVFYIGILHTLGTYTAQEPYVTYRLPSNDSSFSVPFEKIKDWGKYKNMIEAGTLVTTSYDETIDTSEIHTSLKDLYVLTKVLDNHSLQNPQLNFISLELPIALDYLEVNKDHELSDALMVRCAKNYLPSLQEKETTALKIWRWISWQPYTPRYNWLGIVPILTAHMPKDFAKNPTQAPFAAYVIEQFLVSCNIQSSITPNSSLQRYFVAFCIATKAIIKSCKKMLHIPTEEPLHENPLINALITPNESKVSLYQVCENEYYLKKLNNGSIENAVCRIYTTLENTQKQEPPFENEDEWQYKFRTCTIPAKAEFYVKQLRAYPETDKVRKM